MKKRLLLPAALALLLAVVLPACDTATSVDPVGSIDTEDAITDINTIEAIIVAAYDDFQDVGYYSNSFILVPDALADNIVNRTNTGRIDPFANNVQGAHLGRWSGHYSAINQVNIVLENIEDVVIEQAPEVARETRARVTGEALFIRALNYFDLLRPKSYEPGQELNGFDAGVIVRTEGVTELEEADQFFARTRNDSVYVQIERDLREAADSLATTSQTAQSNPGLANEAAALALLSRANLYQGDWAEARDAATDAITAFGGGLVQAGNYVSEWQGGNPPNALFRVENAQGQDGSATNVNDALEALTTPTVGPTDTGGGPNSFFEAVPTQDLLDSYEAGDVRRDLFITPGSTTFCIKYDGYVADFTDNIPVIRLAEMYLNRAEALYELGDPAGARADLNTLRSARGLSDVDPTLSGQALLDAILLERRLELAFEGQRFFDLKRRGLDIPKPQTIGTLPYSDFRILAPLPQGEVDLNPRLEQNPGY
jgi:hypothetical protein